MWCRSRESIPHVGSHSGLEVGGHWMSIWSKLMVRVGRPPGCPTYFPAPQLAWTPAPEAATRGFSHFESGDERRGGSRGPTGRISHPGGGVG